MAALHITNGDAAVPAVAAAAGVPCCDVLPWRDVLHDGPVPGRLSADELARVRADHLAARGWIERGAAHAQLIARDRTLAAHPPAEEIVLWFEADLYDDLQLAQIEDRLAGRPGLVTRVLLPHEPSSDLRSLLLARQPCTPRPDAFAAFRSADPRAWETVPQFARLLEELPDARTGLSRLEREIVDALVDGPLRPHDLFARVTARETVPWIADLPLWALADELAPLVRQVRSSDGPPSYALTAAGEAVRAGRARRSVPERWIGGTQLGPDRPAWAWDADRREVCRLDGISA